MIKDGVVDTTSDAVKKWLPAFENYTLKEVDGGTELLIDIDITDEYKVMFEDMWPRALKTLKELAERGA
jgi:phosphoribosylformylglycinamidine (FGAM) synthase PurS component